MRLLVGVVATAATLVACSSDPTAPLAGLTARTAPPDTSGVTTTVRTSGGNVFIRLTAGPTVEAIAMLREAGLGAPAGLAAIQEFSASHAVAGSVAAGGVRRLALLRFVTGIEASADSGQLYLP
jgi:hypothetical protein